MSHELSRLEPSGVSLLKATASGQIMPAPYAREIRLLKCSIAGTNHTNLESFAKELAPGDTLTLKREPKNPYDANAIRVQDARGRKMGYVPRAKNEVLAALMDAGKQITARLRYLEGDNFWINARMDILLHDG